MIGIAAVFMLIGYMEWIYLRRDSQSPNTIKLMLALGVTLLICSEAVYWTRNSKFSAGMLLNAVFSPIQQWLFAGT